MLTTAAPDRDRVAGPAERRHRRPPGGPATASGEDRSHRHASRQLHVADANLLVRGLFRGRAPDNRDCGRLLVGGRARITASASAPRPGRQTREAAIWERGRWSAGRTPLPRARSARSGRLAEPPVPGRTRRRSTAAVHTAVKQPVMGVHLGQRGDLPADLPVRARAPVGRSTAWCIITRATSRVGPLRCPGALLAVGLGAGNAEEPVHRVQMEGGEDWPGLGRRRTCTRKATWMADV